MKGAVEVPPNHLEITLLGGFSMKVAGKPTVNFSGDRPVSLLAYLLLHRHSPQSRQQIAFTLWPDSSEGQARTNLRNLLFSIRQLLPNADSYLTIDPATLQWGDGTNFTLDVADFEAALAAATVATSTADKISQLETAASLYTGDLLPGHADEWIIPQREELRQSYLHTVHQLLALLEEQQDYGATAHYAQQLLQHDPLDESAYVQLMRMAAHSGDRARVHRLYEVCAAALRRELNIEPSPSTQAIYRSLIQQKVPAMSLSVAPPPPAPAAQMPRPLPASATPFIGRQMELAHVAGLLENPTCRLITIVGPGGIGKTRLALQVAGAFQARFPDGVAFVALDAVTEAIHIHSMIAAALNFTFSGQSDPQAQLFNYLDGKRMLLVLDNVEQLLEEIGLFSDLLQAAATVVLLVTSRERLNLQEEWLFLMDGLPVPQVDDADALDNTGVRLFLQSARRQRPGFVPGRDDLREICRICEMVSGIPLGLELAATWMRMLTCSEIAHELEKGIDFLAISHRNMPPRHQSIRAVFDYSWNLLTPAEQRLFARLAIFQGGFTRQAAQQVTGATLAQLVSLVDKSLIRPVQAGRHTIHELIRQYAANQLADLPDEQEATAVRHSRYFMQMLAQQEAELCSPRQKEVLSHFTAEISNLLRAWDWAAQHQEVDLLRAASWSFWYYFELRGTYQAGERLLQRAEAALQAALSQVEAPPAKLLVTCAKIQSHRAFFLFRCGRSTEALQMADAAVAILRQQRDEDALGDALWTYGAVCWVAGQCAAAADALREALLISRRGNRPWPTVVNTIFLGIMLHELGDYDEAYRLLSEGLAQAQELGDPRPLTFGASFLSRTAQALGRTDQMIALLHERLRQAVDMDDLFGVGISWEQLALGALAMGDLEETYRCFAEGIAIFRDIGDKWSLARVLNHLGDARARAGDVALAEAHYREALAMAIASETWPAIFHALNGLAQIFAREGNLAASWALVTVIQQQPAPPSVQAEVEALRQAIQHNLTPAQQTAVQNWIGKRPLPALIHDILKNKIAM
jgi:predicted ATPase/DNA-binding SARP family transcriptional activator